MRTPHRFSVLQFSAPNSTARVPADDLEACRALLVVHGVFPYYVPIYVGDSWWFPREELGGGFFLYNLYGYCVEIQKTENYIRTIKLYVLLGDKTHSRDSGGIEIDIDRCYTVISQTNLFANSIPKGIDLYRLFSRNTLKDLGYGSLGIENESSFVWILTKKHV